MNQDGVPPPDDLEVRLRVEALLADLSAGFVNLPPDQVDRAVIDAQRRICDCFDLDRSGLWQIFNPPSGPWSLTHFHQRPSRPLIDVGPTTERSFGEGQPSPPGAPPVELRGDAATWFPWVITQLMRGETVVVSRLEALPAEAGRDRDLLRQIGTKGTVVVPLLAGGVVRAAVTFAAMREERVWPETVVKRLHLVAEVFASALARKQAELLLRESEERLSLAAAAAGAGVWEIDLDTGRGWGSPEALALFGFGAGEEFELETIVSKIHPDDREARLAHWRRAIEEKSAYLAEYRVVLPDGHIRWILARGRPYTTASGAPARFMGVSVDITERRQAEDQLRQALADLRRLRDRLEEENLYLRSEAVGRERQTQIAGQSPAIRLAIAHAERVAATSSTVLLVGETGTGKERFATLIHELSPRRGRPMVRVNCAAIPASLIESELFGREKGAYAGALSRQAGRFELADGSTIFLDEIGDLSAEVQVKLLRVLEAKQIERLGSPKPVPVDVRIIAATHQDLERAVREGRFREDLYYRLNVFPIVVPPLRERRADISLLAQMFVDEFALATGTRIDSISKASLEALTRYAWPGNVRELRNVIERAVILATGPTLRIDLLRPTFEAAPAPSQELRDVEREHIVAVLEQTGWRIRGPHGAARLLGLKPTTLESRMNRLGIHRSRGSDAGSRSPK